MKISFDNNPLTETSYRSNSGSNYWKVDWDIGVTEEGSSGSPLFDQNKRVIGQLKGGWSACGSNDMRDWYGCFYRSWTGDGVNSTDSTRLSNWLGIASTTNTIRYPHVTGPSMVCTSNSTFTLHDASPGSTVTWTASRVSPSSGSGTTATFHTTCSNIGNAQLTFTISNSYGSIQVSKAFLSGGPGQSDVSLYIQDNLTGQGVDPWNMCKNSSYYIYYINNSSCSTSNYNWTLPYGMTQSYASQNWVFVNTNSSDGGMLMVHGKTCCTGCGSNVLLYTEYLSTDGYDCGGGWYMSFTPTLQAMKPPWS